MEDRIDRILTVVVEVDSENKLSAVEVHADCRDYMGFYAEELLQFPQIAKDAHWSLIIADYNPMRLAIYIVYIVDETTIQFCCGRSDGSAIRDFAEHYDGDPARLPNALYNEFGNPFEKLLISRAQFDLWLKNDL